MPSALNGLLRIAAAIDLAHFRCVFADRAVPASMRLIEAAHREHGCRDGTPYCRLGHGVRQIVAFEHLHHADDDKCTHENGKKALDPECGAHRDAPYDADAGVWRQRNRPP